MNDRKTSPSDTDDNASSPTTVGADFPNQQARVRKLIEDYRSLSDNAGAFGALMMEQALQRADAAMASGDVVEILRAYQEMAECK